MRTINLNTEAEIFEAIREVAPHLIQKGDEDIYNKIKEGNFTYWKEGNFTYWKEGNFTYWKDGLDLKTANDIMFEGLTAIERRYVNDYINNFEPNTADRLNDFSQHLLFKEQEKLEAWYAKAKETLEVSETFFNLVKERRRIYYNNAIRELQRNTNRQVNNGTRR